jgi:hypothetical protein
MHVALEQKVTRVASVLYYMKQKEEISQLLISIDLLTIFTRAKD